MEKTPFFPLSSELMQWKPTVEKSVWLHSNTHFLPRESIKFWDSHSWNCFFSALLKIQFQWFRWFLKFHFHRQIQAIHLIIPLTNIITNQIRMDRHCTKWANRLMAIQKSLDMFGIYSWNKSLEIKLYSN